jgi:hypothetical protein
MSKPSPLKILKALGANLNSREPVVVYAAYDESLAAELKACCDGYRFMLLPHTCTYTQASP